MALIGVRPPARPTTRYQHPVARTLIDVRTVRLYDSTVGRNVGFPTLVQYRVCAAIDPRSACQVAPTTIRGIVRHGHG